MIQYIKDLWRSMTVCKIDEYFCQLDSSMQAVVGKCEKIEQQLATEVKLLTEEVAMHKGMLHSVAETLPDMMWCKDTEGKYVYANMAIKKGLLFDINPIGKTDIELAKKAKERFGEENHTFGDKCANSDKVVLTNMAPERFLESGMIKGKMVYLEVFKAPWYVNGVLKGVVGTGRNMTEYVEAYRAQECDCNVSDIFKKYEYGESCGN